MEWISEVSAMALFTVCNLSNLKWEGKCGRRSNLFRKLFYGDFI